MRDSLTAARILILALTLPIAPVAAQDEAQTDLDLDDLLEIEIEAATGLPRPLSQAPAVATVITAEEIRAMGARHLDEVLETVPGFHVLFSTTRGLDPVYAVRGVQSASNAQVLILVDGVPITQLLNGGPILGFRLPTTSIERIEVLRGPGSAIYGADAFAGVVHVITKTADDILGTEAGISIGSFGTREAWVAHGSVWKGWDVALSLTGTTTDGDDDRIIQEDLQTPLDRGFGTSTSRAPGPLDTEAELLDVHLALERERWRLNLWAWSNERGLGHGVAGALDPEGVEESGLFLVDVLHHRDDLTPDWDLTGRFTYLVMDQDVRSQVLPAGTLLPVGRDGNVSFDPRAEVRLARFSEGLIGHPGDDEATATLEGVAVHTGLENHRIRLSLGVRRQDANTHEQKNFGPGVLPFDSLGPPSAPPVEIGGELTDVTGTPFIFMEAHGRDHVYFSAQDEWRLSETLELTLGLRYDNYSDFGETWNPRLALVWAANDVLTTKVLFGSAFRAPSFGQQFNINNPASLGNEAIDPETIDTFELAFDYHPRRKLRVGFNLFRSASEGLIALVPDPATGARRAQNARDQDGYGFEAEVEWHRGERFSVLGNFAWQHSEESSTGVQVPFAPERNLYLAARVHPRPEWLIAAELHHVEERPRAAGDPRPPVADDTLVHLQIRRERLLGHLDLALVVRNLFDEDAFEPADPEIPGDFPRAGRGVFAELRVRIP